MAITQQISCDVCGKQKQQVNHCLMYESCNYFQAFHWSDETIRKFKHACGMECLTKALSQWMQEQTKG